VEDKLEITLRITLDRSGLEKRLRHPLENDKAFFVLGLVHAQLTTTFGDDNCQVEMQAATGVKPELIRALSSFAQRHKQAVEALDERGEALVADRDVLEVLTMMHDVIITPIGARWRVARFAPPTCGVGERSKAN
jgi:hypothetical protein